MNEEVNKIIASIGCMAEMAFIHFSRFVEAGFTPEQAFELTKQFMSFMYAPMLLNKTREDDSDDS